MNPLRQQYFVESEGTKYPLRFEFGYFTLAQREIGAQFFPLLTSPIWQEDESQDGYPMMAFLYAGLRHLKASSIKNLSLEWIADNLMADDVKTMADNRAAVGAALRDFTRRLMAKQGIDLEDLERQAQMEAGSQPSTTTGLSPSSISDSTQTSSGA